MTGFSPEDFEVLHQTQAIRNQLIDILTDADLTFRLPGNPTLGEQCRESGQVEQAYIDSFRTLKQKFDYPAVDAALDTDVAKLKEWYATLDANLEAALDALKDTDVQRTMIDRGWPNPVERQLYIYREALLIFYGKATCYLRALGKPLPQQMRSWIG